MKALQGPVVELECRIRGVFSIEQMVVEEMCIFWFV